jgi:amino-acid N-acetyltransferase
MNTVHSPLFASIRPAKMGDIKVIYHLLRGFAEKGLLLGRSISSLYDQLRDFVVYEDEQGVQGVCSLHICWDNLAEIRSLAVQEPFQGQGLGRALVQTCLQEAQRFGITKVFTLTYQGNFFQKLDFVPIEKSELPHKIWSDCLQCPKFPDCDEEALIWTQTSLPDNLWNL